MSQIITDRALEQKWAKVLDHPDAIKLESHKRIIMANMLEQQLKYEVGHASKIMGQPMTVKKESTYSGGNTGAGAMTTFNPILVPMARRVGAQLISMDIFGQQPMNGPSGTIFAVRPTYQGNPVDGEAGKRTQTNIVILADASTFSVGDAIASDNTTPAHGIINHIEDNSVLVTLATGSPSFTIGDDVDDADPFATAVTSIAMVYKPDYTDPMETNEALFQFVFKKWSYYDTVMEGEKAGAGINQLGFEIEQHTVTAKTHKAAANFTLELEEDYAAVHGEDAKQELYNMTADHMALEQNLEFIDELYTVAELNPIETFNFTGSDIDGRWRIEKAQTAISKINLISSGIADSTHTGEATFLVATKKILNLAKDSGRFEKNADLANMTVGAKIGRLDGQYDVFYNRYRQNKYKQAGTAMVESCIVGRKGDKQDAGIIHAPYIPITPMEMIDPTTLEKRIVLRSRYGSYHNPFSARGYYKELIVTNI